MEIRRVNLNQKSQEDLEWLDRLSFPGDTPYPKKGAEWWIAYDEKTCIGFAGIKNVGHDTAFLCRVGVIKAYRGQGLQKKMVRVRERWARSRGFHYIITYTSAYNLKSANSLIQCGYRLYNPQNPYGMENALYFRKNLWDNY
jgi:RimJ/RimL family protein N-acetyltransferase